MAAPHPLLLPLILGRDLPKESVIDESAVASAEEHLVAGLVDAAIANRDLDVDVDLRLRLAKSTLAAAAENSAALTAMDAVTTAAHDIGVEVGFFKGVVTGAQFYEDPALRPTLDVDVFVDPSHLDRMGDLAGELGADPENRKAIDAMVAEGRVFEVSLAADATEVDLHRDPMNMLLPSRGEHARWQARVPVTLASGRTVHTLDPEWTIIHAVLHGFRDNFADLLHIHDLARMIGAKPDWDRIDAIAKDEGWRDLIRYGTAFVSDVLGEPSPLPRTVSRASLATIRAIWPRSLLLHGAESLVLSHRRQSALSLLTRGRSIELARAYRQRAFPPRSVIDQRANPTTAAYPVALYEWRMTQRRTNLDRRMTTDVDGETL